MSLKSKIRVLSVFTNGMRRQIPGVADRYTVDHRGNVYSNDIMLNPSPNKRGYKNVTITPASKGKRLTMGVHRLVALAWVSGRDVGRGRDVVDHINGIKSDNDSHNLRWVTRRENSLLAAYEQGLLARTPKPVKATRLEDGFVMIFRSMVDACHYTQADWRHMNAILKGTEPRKSCNGWTFEYV